MKNYLTRRGFIRTAAASSAALTWLSARNGPNVFAADADKLQLELIMADPATRALLDTVRLLNIAMMHTARRDHFKFLVRR